MKSFSMSKVSKAVVSTVAAVMLAPHAFAQNIGDGNPLIAQSNTQNQNVNPNILSTGMPQKSLGKRLWENTTLTYYQQFLGPTADGDTSRTYNVFQEGIDTPNSGYAPLQSFHALNLRHQINTDWAVGATLAMTNGYSGGVENRNRYGETFENRPDSEFFNARVYVSVPSMRTKIATFYTTLSVEAPSSETSKNNDMRYGWVAAQNMAFNLQNIKWSAGLNYQIYRLYYNNNVIAPPFVGARPTPMQTMIVSGGPYVNYRFSDKWQLGSVLTFDWDQRGAQSGTTEFNNNLPHRGRVALTYFPQSIKYLQSVGLFTQALLKFRPGTTALGADFSVRF